MKNKLSPALKTLLKIAFVVALLTFLARKGLISLDATRKAFGHLELMGPAIGLLLITSGLGVLRWQLLLQAQGISLPFRRIFQLTFIGNFFNIAIPGAVSGDFVKAFYVGNEVPGLRARAFGSILFDRVAGVAALVVVSATALTLDIGELWGTPLFTGVQVIVSIAALGVIVFFAYLFFVRDHRDPLFKLLKAAEGRHKAFGSILRIYEGLKHYSGHPGTVIKVMLISMVIHVMVGSACVMFLRALDESISAIFPVFVVVPLGLLVTAVPVAPAGVGTGHAAFGWLFQFLGTQHGADVFTLYALMQIFLGAIGGLIYLRFKSKEGISFAPPQGTSDADTPPEGASLSRVRLSQENR